VKRPIVVHIKTAPEPIRQKLPPDRHDYTPSPPPNPLTLASLWLGRRLVEKADSGFWLDGTPASLDDVMRATNRILKAHRIEQLGRNPKWLV
jgi:hypothetical protein